RAARDRNGHGHFRVAEPGKPTRHSRNDHGQRDGGAGVQRGGNSGENENAGPNDGSDTQGRKTDWSERPAQSVFAQGVGLRPQHGDRLGSKQAHGRPRGSIPSGERDGVSVGPTRYEPNRMQSPLGSGRPGFRSRGGLRSIEERRNPRYYLSSKRPEPPHRIASAAVQETGGRHV